MVGCCPDRVRNLLDTPRGVGEVMSDGAFGMSPESAEQFNETLRVLFSGPAGPLLAFGMVLVVALLLTWIDTIAKGKK